MASHDYLFETPLGVSTVNRIDGTTSNGADCWWHLKELLVAVGGVIRASGDGGSNYDATGGTAVANNAAGANGIRVARAWWWVEMPDGTHYTFQLVAATGTTIRIKTTTHADGFDAGSPNATTTPTTTGTEDVLYGGGSDAAPSGYTAFVAGATNRTACGVAQSAPYGFFTFGWTAAGATSGSPVVCTGILGADGDTSPMMAWFKGGGWTSAGITDSGDVRTIFSSGYTNALGNTLNSTSQRNVPNQSGGGGYEHPETGRMMCMRIHVVSTAISASKGWTTGILWATPNALPYGSLARYNMADGSVWIATDISVLIPWPAATAPDTSASPVEVDAYILDSGETADETAPTVTFTTSTASPLTSSQVIELEATDEDPGLALLHVAVKFPNVSLYEVVFDGSAFGSRYNGATCVRTAITDGFSLAFARSGGWPDTSAIVVVNAVDAAGNVTTSTETYDILSASSAATTPSVAEATAGETARDLLLDSSTGDLIVSGGDLSLVTDTSAIAQALRLRLHLFLGEWFLDEEVGIPYFQSILVKNPSFAAVREVFRQAILEVPGVDEVQSLEIDYSGVTRQMTIAFRATTDLGELAETIEVTI